MDHIKYWQEHGKIELSHTAGGNVKFYYFLSSLLPRFVKFYVPCDSAILPFSICSRELLPCKYLCANFHRNFTCHSQRLEAMHMSKPHEWIKQIVVYMRCYSAKKNMLLINYNPIGKSCIDFSERKRFFVKIHCYILWWIQHWASPRRHPLDTTVKAFAVMFGWGGKTHSECRQHNPMGWGPGLNKKRKEHNISISSSQFPDCGYNVTVFSISIACFPYHDGFCLQTVSQK